ncbi:MAG: DUF1190 domain-containing protein [Hyphomicrobiaceae bacterium]|nr:DUF1190 domain-containing protein [Hyphomicrobiaceae bacterium]
MARLSTLIGLSVVAALGLTGCGKSTKSSGPVDWKGVFTTATDCADAGKLSYDECSDAMARAVADHESNATTYSELRFCEAKEGPGRCEFGSGKYRSRLLAFLVTEGKPPKAMPLYPPAKGKTGFRDSGGTLYTTDNEQLTFSEHAQTMFETHATKKR